VDDDDVAQFKTAVAQVRQKSSSTKIQAVPMHAKNIKIKKQEGKNDRSKFILKMKRHKLMDEMWMDGFHSL